MRNQPPPRLGTLELASSFATPMAAARALCATLVTMRGTGVEAAVESSSSVSQRRAVGVIDSSESSAASRIRPGASVSARWVSAVLRMARRMPCASKGPRSAISVASNGLKSPVRRWRARHPHTAFPSRKTARSSSPRP